MTLEIDKLKDELWVLIRDTDLSPNIKEYLLSELAKPGPGAEQNAIMLNRIRNDSLTDNARRNAVDNLLRKVR